MQLPRVIGLTGLKRSGKSTLARELGTLGYENVAFADPPYGTGAAEGLAELFREKSFAQQLWIEHRAGEPMPELPGSHTRRYGDTALTFIPALESE